MSEIITLLAFYGLTNIIVNSGIAQPFRDWVSYSGIEDSADGKTRTADLRWKGWGKKLIDCMMCVGFWVGLLSFGSLTGNFLIDMLASSGIAWIVHIWLSSLGHPEFNHQHSSDDNVEDS